MKSYNNQGTYNFQCTIKASFDELRAINANVFNDTKDAKGNGVTVFEGLEKDQTETIREMNKIGDQLLNATLKLKKIEDILNEKPKDDGFLTTEYLMAIHPELDWLEAYNLLQFTKSKTIRRKECYGDGSNIFPQWLKFLDHEKYYLK